MDITKIREQFPVLDQEVNGYPMVFLDTAASSQKPASVIAAIENYYQKHHANVHRGVYKLSQRATDMFEAARHKVQKFIGAADEKEIIFTRGATEAINLVASSFGDKFIGKGDVILLSGMEHHSNIVPWQLIAEKKEAVIKVIPVLEDGSLDLVAMDAILEAGVKLLAITQVSNTLGTINPIKSIVQKAHEAGAVVLVDGAQAIPHMQVDVVDLDVDFYVFSAHKMYGPTGMGILYGKADLLNQMPPYHGGGEMIERVTFEKTTFNELPFKFEAGTPNIAGAVGLSAAIDFMEEIGVENIHHHEMDLLAYATEKLSQIEGLKIYGTAADKSGVVSFNVGNAHPYDVGTILDKLGIAVRTGHHCTQPLMDRFDIPGTVRASFGIYNTREEVDQLVKGVERAAKML
ncbi:MAG: cysteine desulfurase, partial [Saprospiraceae bacterium]|nr:cysteine desulfurase [Saprospiraceae bacterium]